MPSPPVKRVGQLCRTTKGRGVILYTFWSGDDQHKATMVDAYGNTNQWIYSSYRELTEAYQKLIDDYNYKVAEPLS